MRLNIALLTGLLLAALFVPAAAGASVEYCKVLEIFGQVEIREAGGEWRPLAAARLLKGGDKLRTFDKSYADLAASSDLSAMMRLGPNADVEVMGDDLTRFFLRRGSFFVLREEDGAGPRRKVETLFQIFTRDLVADLLGGGISVTVLEKGSLLCVYSEQAKASLFGAKREKLYPQTVSEGFKVVLETPRKPAPPSRLVFSDYSSWQFWIRKCYDRKDLLAKGFSNEGLKR